MRPAFEQIDDDAGNACFGIAAGFDGHQIATTSRPPNLTTRCPVNDDRLMLRGCVLRDRASDRDQSGLQPSCGCSRLPWHHQGW